MVEHATVNMTFPKFLMILLQKDLITQKEFSDIRENMIRGIQYLNKEIAKKFQDHPDEILK